MYVYLCLLYRTRGDWTGQDKLFSWMRRVFTSFPHTRNRARVLVSPFWSKQKVVIFVLLTSVLSTKYMLSVLLVLFYVYINTFIFGRRWHWHWQCYNWVDFQKYNSLTTWRNKSMLLFFTGWKCNCSSELQWCGVGILANKVVWLFSNFPFSFIWETKIK